MRHGFDIAVQRADLSKFRGIFQTSQTHVLQAIRPEADEHATISCGIDLTDYAAVCVANGINQAYEIAAQS
jgi:hypothetical protein